MTIVIMLNDPPYGMERSYNGLWLAPALKKNAPDTESRRLPDGRSP